MDILLSQNPSTFTLVSLPMLILALTITAGLVAITVRPATEILTVIASTIRYYLPRPIRLWLRRQHGATQR